MRCELTPPAADTQFKVFCFVTKSWVCVFCFVFRAQVRGPRSAFQDQVRRPRPQIQTKLDVGDVVVEVASDTFHNFLVHFCLQQSLLEGRSSSDFAISFAT